jgi:uncharacterized NAD-dependent epimerase/dehydratase family protein
VVDSKYAGKTVCQVVDSPRDCPVVGSIREAIRLGAEVLVLGIAPSGGMFPPEWEPGLAEAVQAGLSVVNGLHDRLSERFGPLRDGQWIWDIRREPPGLGIARGEARLLGNTRVLTVGTDMANGKMTSGLLLVQAAREAGIRAEFLATGQIGITITGRGLPLDAVRVDYAAGAVEKFVLETGRECDLLVVEGQGSLLHPGSTGTLPLMRGTCPTHLILCHRAGQTTLRSFDWLPVPPLRDVVALCEAVVSPCGLLPRARVAAISLNTAGLSPDAAQRALDAAASETGLPVADPVRFGAAPLLEAIR